MDKDLIDGIRENNQREYNHCVVQSADHSGSSTEADLKNSQKIPKEQKHFASRGNVLEDQVKIKDYNMKEGETIELTAALLGCTKRDESRPPPKSEEREAKSKASEPLIEISGIEDDKSASMIHEERMERVMRKVEETMKSVSYRMNDISTLEHTEASVSFQITDMTSTMNRFDSKPERMSEAFTQMTAENQARDRKIAEAFSQMNAENRVRDQKFEEQITNLEKRSIPKSKRNSQPWRQG